MHYTFIDIGCGHTNVSVDTYGTTVRGLLVEPIKEFCNVLPSSETVLVECSAVSDIDGEINLHTHVNNYAGEIKYFPIKYLTSNKHLDRINKRYGLHGSESIHNTATNYSSRVVPCMRLETLLLKYNIDEVDQLKIDVEGHENVILKQLIELMRSSTLKVNHRIIFEYNHLSDKKELDALTEMISTDFGFKTEFKKIGWNEDIIMTKKV